MNLYKGKVAEPMFEGTEVKVRGEIFIVPELNIRNRRKVEEKIAKWFGHAETLLPGSAEYREFRETVESIAALALRQNYPELSEDEVLDLFTESQILRIFRLALGQPADPVPVKGDQPARPTSAPNGAVSLVS